MRYHAYISLATSFASFVNGHLFKSSGAKVEGEPSTESLQKISSLLSFVCGSHVCDCLFSCLAMTKSAVNLFYRDVTLAWWECFSSDFHHVPFSQQRVV